jgi:hypothetical protein
MSEMIPGGWSGFNFTITPEAREIFDAALKGFVGVQYTPLACATQVVAGINYCYLCQGVVVYPNAPEIAAKLYVYKPPQGNPHITRIDPVTP